MDTTGHNIANASTKGYSRQEAVMAAAPALTIASGAIQGGAGAHIGAGVDIQAYRRVRDTFLDLQYRAQATRLGQEAGRAEGLDRAELALAEPSDDGINKQLSDFWDAWSNLSKAPEDQAARQALVEQASTLGEAFATVDQQLALVGQQSRDEFDALTAPGGEIEQISREIVALNDTIRKFVTAGDTPNDLMDQRDLLLDRLSELGQTSVTDNGDGSVSVTFGATGTPMIDATGFHYQAPATLTNAGGRLGALQSLSNVPGGEIDSYRLELGQVADLPRERRERDLRPSPATAPRSSPPTGPYAAGSFGLAAGVTAANVRTGPSAEQGDNKLALEIAELRGDAPDGAYARSSRASAPRGARRPATRRTPRRSPTPSRTAARASPASRSTRRWATSSASSAPTRPRRAPCRRWTRCSTSSSTAPGAWGCEPAHHHRHDAAQRAVRPQPGQRVAHAHAVRSSPRTARSRGRPTIRSTPPARCSCASRSPARSSTSATCRTRWAGRRPPSRRSRR